MAVVREGYRANALWRSEPCAGAQARVRRSGEPLARDERRREVTASDFDRLGFSKCCRERIDGIRPIGMEDKRRRLLGPIGFVPPAEFEATYYQQVSVA